MKRAAPPRTIAPPPAAGLAPDAVLAGSGSNFRTAFLCIDPERRDGMTAIYAFCRVADDAADDAPDRETGAAHVAFWREELAAATRGAATTPVGRALAATMARFGTERAALDALLDGVAMDLLPSGFADEQELRHYCDCVASAVGRACLPVLGASGPAAVRFANALGQALQFTNILRDLRVDAAIGRVYAPRSWLAECAVDAAWLDGDGPPAAYAPDGPIARLRARFVATARGDFAAAYGALAELPRPQRRALVPARIMAAVYRSLLGRLTGLGGALPPERVRVPKAIKLWWAASIQLGVSV
ncbi:MAG: squalene/phytoene synthase family protein [Planctomycetes bacterium]|nr:squalene/phytoene synthase family protein [Planctomycetota bacterium]